MSLHLDVVCEQGLSFEDRQSKTIRVIAEVLPLVLAKYGIGSASAHAARDQSARRASRRRFEIQ
jgi:hypothetical protein